MTEPNTPIHEELNNEIARRRTFAIISHPDAGKTTLTEKLLLYGGAIRLAGAVKAKSNQKHTTSDWMEIEKQRGISISTSVLQFDYNGYKVNLLDTPGHKDFSEDTYRTLTAADAAVMLIDAAKGVEPQTRKLFEVCRMRGIPIFTFINKLDRPGRDPLELIDELEQVLGIRSCPMSWPIGAGDTFKGIFDRRRNEILFFQKAEEANVRGILAPKSVAGVDDPEFLEFIGGDTDNADDRKRLHHELISQIELLEIAGDPYDHERILAGQLTPVFFGSAMNNFGVERFLEHFLQIAPPPVGRNSADGPIAPSQEQFSGFVFKIQANMDPLHRDRVAFMRICSGKFTRGMDVLHARLNRKVRLSKSFHFFAQDREIIEDAWPGDVIGLIDTSGDLRIGDTLCEGKRIEFEGVPRFSPEHFASVTIVDPMKRKQFVKGVEQLTEEGVIQAYRMSDGVERAPILGAVGPLQFEIFKHRMKSEYGADIRIEKLPYVHARWLQGSAEELARYNQRFDNMVVLDRDGHRVVLFKSDFELRWAQENFKALSFLTAAPR